MNAVHARVLICVLFPSDDANVEVISSSICLTHQCLSLKLISDICYMVVVREKACPFRGGYK